MPKAKSAKAKAGGAKKKKVNAAGYSPTKRQVSVSGAAHKVFTKGGEEFYRSRRPSGGLSYHRVKSA